MSPFPDGCVTFLFTDVEGSTRLWEEDPEAMREALARHDTLLRTLIETHGGIVFKTVGDAFCSVFAAAPDALRAALAVQRSLPPTGAHPRFGPLRVRMALHTGEAELRDGDYFGPTLSRISRLLSAGHGGQVLLSDAAREALGDDLSEGISLQDRGIHRLKDLQQPEHVFQLRHPDLESDFPPLRTLSTHPNNLPLQLTSFIGRGHDLEEVKRFLQTARLLTLTGAGGTGKTRLALQVGAEVLELFPEGVWLVELAALVDPGLVPQAVATALGIKEASDQALVESLVESLRLRRALILLDNCEHLLAASSSLAERILRSCPGVRILATSREPLGIVGEQTYRVPSLPLPDTETAFRFERLQSFPAVQLFLDRARLGQPAFALNEKNARSVVQVCRRLDGIPLAIELAAARVKTMPVQKLDERLDDRFRLLTGGSSVALPRQQTLRALIDWSYDLLKERERRLLRRLAVFAGSCSLEAAEAVWAKDTGDRSEVLDLLAGLVEKSLLIYEDLEEGRYRLLETVRQYALERLSETGEAPAARREHLEYFLGMAEEERPGREPPGSSLKELGREYDNLRAALGFALEVEPAAGLTLGNALGQLWMVRGDFAEGRSWLERGLSRGHDAPAPLRALAATTAGSLALRQGDYEGAVRLLQEGLLLHRLCGNQRGAASALTELGIAADERGDYARGRALYQEGLAIRREVGDRRGSAVSLLNLGVMASRERQHAEAAAFFEEALGTFKELGDERGAAYSINNLASIAFSQGDYETARTRFREALMALRRLQDRRGLAYALEGVAQVFAAVGHASRAASLFGAAEALREAIDSPVPPSDRGEYDCGVASVRGALGEQRLAEAWALGRAMELDEAIGNALADNDLPNNPSAPFEIKV